MTGGFDFPTVVSAYAVGEQPVHFPPVAPDAISEKRIVATAGPAILGLDPGKDGALVVLRGNEALAVVLTDHLLVATEVKRKGGKVGKRRDYSPAAMIEALGRLVSDHGPLEAVLETASIRPGEGGVGALTTGIGWGLWRMALQALSIPTMTPVAASWARVVLRDAPGEGKARAIHVASSRVPGLRLIPERCRVPHTGIADACCLALYGQHRLGAGGSGA